MMKKYINTSKGFTIIETLIALLITGIITTAAFQFYIKLSERIASQEDVTDIQYIGRASINELTKTIRLAGYKIDTSHVPFEITNDSIFVYFQDSLPVDTVLYYLEEYSDHEYAQFVTRPNGMPLYKLMKRINSGSVNVFADNIKSVRFQETAANEITLSLVIESPNPDNSYNINNGYRTFILDQRVLLRNVKI